MWAEFRHTLLQKRGQVIGWAVGLALYGILMVSFFDSIAGMEEFEEFMSAYPEAIKAFFGDLMRIATPEGYLDIYYFGYMTVIIGIFAVSAGAGLLVSDEERGILDLVLAHPVSRSALFWGRVTAITVALALILTAGWLSWVLPAQGTGMDLTWMEFLLPFLPLMAELLLFCALALLLSVLLPSLRMASMLTGGLLVANYLIIGLANINEKLKPIVKFTPLHYYQGGAAIDGIDWLWFGGLMAATVLLTMLAWWRFQRRDIRVGGEGGWRLAVPWRRRGKEVALEA